MKKKKLIATSVCSQLSCENFKNSLEKTFYQSSIEKFTRNFLCNFWGEFDKLKKNYIILYVDKEIIKKKLSFKLFKFFSI